MARLQQGCRSPSEGMWSGCGFRHRVQCGDICSREALLLQNCRTATPGSRAEGRTGSRPSNRPDLGALPESRCGGTWRSVLPTGAGRRGRCHLAEAAERPPTAPSPREDLKGQTIVVVGLGASGRAAAKLALARGAARVIGLDSREDAAPLQEDEEGAGGGSGRVSTELGPHREATLMAASRIVLSPGVPLTQRQVAAAIASGVPAVSELGFAAEVLPAGLPVAAVTGTNGKSTVTTFAGQFLQASGVRTFVGGNLGTPLSMAALHTLSFPADSPHYQAAVVEVSSYQMELPCALRPRAAVVLNLTPDHLERHGTLEAYGAAKCRLFRHMGPSDLAVIPKGDKLLQSLAAQAGGSATRAWLGGTPGVQLDAAATAAAVAVPTTGAAARLDLTALRAAGAHNALNAGAAALLAMALDVGVSAEALQATLPSLRPPPHRMEVVYEDGRGVLWVDDSKATNVEAARAGVAGMAGRRRAVVLLGGRAKAGAAGGGFGFGRLADALASHRAVVAFGEAGPSIQEELRAAGLSIPCKSADGLEAAVESACHLAQPGDAVLLSPACASFDEFDNFEHRGEVFARLAKQARQF